MTRYIDRDQGAAYRKSPLPGYEHRHADDDLSADDIRTCLNYLNWLRRSEFTKKSNEMRAEYGLPPDKVTFFFHEKRGKEIYRQVLRDIEPYFQHSYLLQGERDQVLKELYRRQKELTTPFRRVSKRCMVPLTTVTKFVSDGKRTIRGVASSSQLDRMGDIVDPHSGNWQTPLPLLWAHDHQAPIGSVRSVEVSGEQILFEAEIVSGIAKADEVWSLIEQGALDSVSIGFQARAYDELPNGGRLFKDWTLLELSVVSVPANSDAKIRRSHGGAVRIDRHRSNIGDRERALRNGAISLKNGGAK